MKIIILRHGETLANVKGIYSGWTDYDLTPKGQKQAKKIGEKLKNENIEVIYSSPLKRALKTAKYIADIVNKDINIEDRLKEINFGIFEGKTHEEIIKSHKEQYEYWTLDYINNRILKGESLKDLYIRVRDFITELRSKDGDKTYVLVTHGGVIQVLITILLGIDIEKMWNFKVPPGALVEIEYNEGFGILTKLLTNDFS